MSKMTAVWMFLTRYGRRYLEILSLQDRCYYNTISHIGDTFVYVFRQQHYKRKTDGYVFSHWSFTGAYRKQLRKCKRWRYFSFHDRPFDLLHVSEQDCDYELYAVVDHVGSLRGGHYTSRIKSYQNHNWYVFDDSYVTQVRDTQLFKIQYIPPFYFLNVHTIPSYS